MKRLLDCAHCLLCMHGLLGALHKRLLLHRVPCKRCQTDTIMHWHCCPHARFGGVFTRCCAGPSQVGVSTRTFAPIAPRPGPAGQAPPGGRRRLQAPGDLTELTVTVVPTPDNVRFGHACVLNMG